MRSCSGHVVTECEQLKSASDSTAASDLAQTICPPRDSEPLDHHFASFVKAKTSAGEMKLLELDGTKPWPIDHGPTSERTFLADVGKVVRNDFMAKNPDCIEFSLMALVRSQA